MNIIDVSELSYKNGYAKGYANGKLEQITGNDISKIYFKLRHCKTKKEFIEKVAEIINDMGGEKFTKLYFNLPD